jgi:hypothetical protein
MKLNLIPIDGEAEQYYGDENEREKDASHRD